MRARSFVPFQQGDLDNLCGLYCIVNAVAVAVHRRPLLGEKVSPLRLRRFDDKHADHLFEALVRTVDRCIGLRSVFERGIKTPIFGKLLVSADRHLCLRHGTRLFWSKPYHKRKAIEPALLRRHLERHLEAPHTSAIIGYQEHWSAVSSVTLKRLALADSSNDLWLVTGGRAGQNRGLHVREIWPTSIFLVRLVAVPLLSLPAKTKSLVVKPASRAGSGSARSSSIRRGPSRRAPHSAGSV